MTVEDLLREARERIDRVTPEEATREIEDGALLVDTRCAQDRQREGEIPGSVHIARSVLEWRADPACEARDPRIADPSARLILVCNDGYSSSLAAANLRRMGFARIADLVGGYRGWVAAGLPTRAV
jgi:rhodanese-related sulfurtransferase